MATMKNWPKRDPGKLPDFIVCGFQKCGTSALSQNLNQHSDISIARTSHVKANLSYGKEINYYQI